MKQAMGKQAIIAVLGAGDNPQALSMNQLLAALADDYAVRSIRRWLADLAAQGLVEKTGNKKGTSYRLVTVPAVAAAPAFDYSVLAASRLMIAEPTTPYQATPATTPPAKTPPTTRPINQSHPASGSSHGLFSAQAQQIINTIMQPLYHRQPVTYDFAWFDHYQPNQSFYFTEAERALLHNSGLRVGQPLPAGTYARKIYNRLLIDLSYHSSRLEGNTYSLLETEQLLSQGISADDKLDGERIMILNHKEAVRYLVEHSAALTVDFESICSLHFLLSDALLPTDQSGQLRDQGVRIGRSCYIPLEGQQRLVSQLQNICNKAAQINDPFEQSVFLLVHIAYLQGFMDVNKRTARLSANIPLINHNLVPLSFNDIEASDYAAAMIAVYELKQTRPLIELYCHSYLRSCQQYDVTLEALGFDEIRARFRLQRRSLISQIISQLLVGDAIEQAIEQYCQAHIPEQHQAAFWRTVNEDLAALSPVRIAGMAISQRQLSQWLQLQAIPPERA